MSDEKETFRPYAALSNVLATIQRARTRNLPEIINNDFLRVTGMPEVVFGRVMQTLRFLNLVYEDGRPSDKFESLAGASDAQYRELLEAIIREAYRTEFNIVDPSQDPQPRIVDAFQPYQPRSQTSRMVMLFLGLCREAGIPVLDAPRERRMKEAQTKSSKSASGKRSVGVPSKKPSYEHTIAPSINRTKEVLFGVTEDDIAVLKENEFNEVWTALGIVARARARAKKETEEKQAKLGIQEDEESAEDIPL